MVSRTTRRNLLTDNQYIIQHGRVKNGVEAIDFLDRQGDYTETSHPN